MIKQNKKSYALLITIILISLLSYSSIYLLELKSLSNTNNKNNYLYIQGGLHLDFFTSYIKELKDFDYKKIELEDEKFEIYALITTKCTQNKNTCADIFVKYKDIHNSISLHKRIILK